MKDVRKTLLERRSIRRYEREQLTENQLDLIYDAIENTPTSYNGQQFTVIDVSDQEVKERLYELTGQKQIKTCSHFMVFCADYYRIHKAAEAKGISWPGFNNTADGLIVGVVDAALAMMSAIVAAESMGLGICPIGYARTAAPTEISGILGLPDEVFVVCGLAIGVPREMPDLKPKMSRSLLIHGNEYRRDNIAGEVLEYDKLIEEYTANRSGQAKVHAWIDNIIGYYSEAMDYTMLDALMRRGFSLER